MPKRDDIKSILVIGSGPIVIGQACEFDYSGAQACKVLREEGYRVILVNSNPATIMTDPELADATYVEPITPAFVEKVIAKERPDACLPTLGGQTGLNTAVELAKSGVLERYGVELIGCDVDVIERGEDRKLFHECMADLGIEVSRAGNAYSVEDALAIAEELGYPVVLRPSFTMGGAGGGIARDADELVRIVSQGLELSPAGEVLVEESIEGWKEYEMEVMRDAAGNGIIVCSIENLDPMGVHTGDSITVAPAQTLTDLEYQRMRAASLAVLERVGVATGGSNVQFAVHPETGRMVIIEMNPRVSRSSALASKATGFPIAKAAARLAVGYTLDEIVNDMTGTTPACFEPTIDYCVVKAPRFAFEKFQGADDTLTTRMKAVGEVMAVGRTFEESLGKALRSLETGRAGFGADGKGEETALTDEELFAALSRPTAERIFLAAEALRRGMSAEELHERTAIDMFFCNRMADMVAVQEALRGCALEDMDAEAFQIAKRYGLSDAEIAVLTGSDERTVRACRKILGVRTAFKTVDTCAAEFPTKTAYHYKTYDADESEVARKERPRALILGAGPNRIGQGIEFDYCCVHASYALADAGYETIMVNCNPETVSTDYDTSDMLFFEPLTYEDVMDVIDATDPDGVVVTLGGQTPLKLARALEEAGVPIMGTSPVAIDLAEDRDRFAALLDSLDIAYPRSAMASGLEEARTIMVNCNPETVSTDYDTSDMLFFEPLTYEDVMDVIDATDPDGVVVTLGGQTPLKLARALEEAGVPIMGTSPVAIDLAEDRDRFAALLDSLDIAYPRSAMASGLEEARSAAREIGYPLLVRPSYVLGGRGMGIVYDDAGLARYVAEATAVSPDHPVYLDKFLEGAVECDLDALCDGEDVYIGGILEHIEMAGIHSGDSACCLPPFSLSAKVQDEMASVARKIALALGVRGLVNIQFAVKDGVVYVIEANPRASRTVPFISKATGVPLAKLASRIMAGEKLAALKLPEHFAKPGRYFVKEAVMPFGRFPGADALLGPEMRSTGEVMGIAESFPAAYMKTQMAIDYAEPDGGMAFISVNDQDKRAVAFIARELVRLGFSLLATEGTAAVLRASGVPCEVTGKIHEGKSSVVDAIAAGEISLMINTPLGMSTRDDGYELRRAAVRHGITYATTLAAAQALIAGLQAARAGELDVAPLQEL